MIVKRFYILFIVQAGASMCFSQTKSKSLQGKVTFVTSTNVYVRFEDTKSITIGDTLHVSRGSGLSPCLIVNNKSSTSSVASIINGCDVKVGDQIVHTSTQTPVVAVVDKSATVAVPKSATNSKPHTEKIRGSISAASYSTLSSARNNTRVMYRLSFSAPHINQSKFSVETYMNYRQTFKQTDSQSIKPKDVFNVYSLSLQYDITSTMSLVVGRKINSKVSSIGAIDGLQFEKSFGNFYTGVIAGFRPDIIDYGFNPNLLQYGAFAGIKSDTKSIYSQTTLGMLEQKNNGSTDRRYAYFQHSSTLGGRVNIFSSAELDLYNPVSGDSVGKMRWTNIFISASYRVNRKIDFSLSYNARKQIVYYETLKTEIERILDDDIARQGLRLNINFRPYKYIGVGGAYNKRFQSNDLNQADNLNGYFSLSKIPWIGGRVNVNVNRNKSSYMKTDIFSFRYSRSFIEMKLDADIYYRMVNYTYFTSETLTEQRYYGAAVSYRLPKKIIVSVLGELATTTLEENYRINARISKNF